MNAVITTDPSDMANAPLRAYTQHRHMRDAILE